MSYNFLVKLNDKLFRLVEKDGNLIIVFLLSRRILHDKTFHLQDDTNVTFPSL